MHIHKQERVHTHTRIYLLSVLYISHKKYYSFNILFKMLILIYWKKINMLICIL